MEFPRPEYWSGWPFSPPGDLPNQGIELRSPTLQGDSIPATSEAKLMYTGWVNNKVLLYDIGNYIQYPVINLSN